MNSVLGLAHALKIYDNVALDRIGTHVIENFFGNVRYNCNNYDSFENIMSAISYTIIRKRIFYKYQFRIQINKRANAGGIHLYEENETGLISCNDSILNIRNILFKLTNIYRIDAGENNVNNKSRKFFQ